MLFTRSPFSSLRRDGRDAFLPSIFFFSPSHTSSCLSISFFFCNFLLNGRTFSCSALQAFDSVFCTDSIRKFQCVFVICLCRPEFDRILLFIHTSHRIDDAWMEILFFCLHRWRYGDSISFDCVLCAFFFFSDDFFVYSKDIPFMPEMYLLRAIESHIRKIEWKTSEPIDSLCFSGASNRFIPEHTYSFQTHARPFCLSSFFFGRVTRTTAIGKASVVNRLRCPLGKSIRTHFECKTPRRALSFNCIYDENLFISRISWAVNSLRLSISIDHHCRLFDETWKE